MNQESTNKYQKELEALKAGKVIQNRLRNVGGVWGPWMAESDPSFLVDETIEFRIEPQPREWWIVEGPNFSAVFTDELKAVDCVRPVLSRIGAGEIIHVREI